MAWILCVSVSNFPDMQIVIQNARITKEAEERKMALGALGYPPNSPSLNLQLPQEGQMFMHPSCCQIEPFAYSSSSLTPLPHRYGC
jgi:hypothetical protein